jgi:hypothetical protein
MIDVARTGALVTGLVCVLVGLWGLGMWWRVASMPVYSLAIRVAQGFCVAQAVLAGVLWAAGDKVDDGLYFLYACLPVFVSFAAEQLRILSAQTVLDARGLPDAQAVGALDEASQRSIVVAILRRETGVMALSLLVIAFLCWRGWATV